MDLTFRIPFSSIWAIELKEKMLAINLLHTPVCNFQFSPYAKPKGWKPPSSQQDPYVSQIMNVVFSDAADKELTACATIKLPLSQPFQCKAEGKDCIC